MRYTFSVKPESISSGILSFILITSQNFYKKTVLSDQRCFCQSHVASHSFRAGSCCTFVCYYVCGLATLFSNRVPIFHQNSPLFQLAQASAYIVFDSLYDENDASKIRFGWGHLNVPCSLKQVCTCTINESSSLIAIGNFFVKYGVIR